MLTRIHTRFRDIVVTWNLYHLRLLIFLISEGVLSKHAAFVSRVATHPVPLMLQM